MAVLVNVKRTLAMKLESTPGTAIAVADADFNLRFFDIGVDPDIEMWVNNFASGRHSVAGGVMGKKKITITAKHALNLAAVGVAPLLSKAFKICGQTETIVGATSCAWTPDATKDEAVTATIKVIYVPTSGNAIIVTAKGCMGNFVVSMDELGHPLVVSFTFVGAFVSIADGTALVLTSPDTTIPPAVIGSAITAAGNAVGIGKMSLDAGNDVQMDLDPSDATGYLMAYIASRKPKWMMDPKMKLLATDAVYTRWAAGTESILSLATATVSAVKATISAPKGQLTGNKFGARNEVVTFEQEYELHESSGNDAHSILISA